eukprot:10255607-Alexandrium_andersonii.AAC.1
MGGIRRTASASARAHMHGIAMDTMPPRAAPRAAREARLSRWRCASSSPGPSAAWRRPASSHA